MRKIGLVRYNLISYKQGPSTGHQSHVEFRNRHLSTKKSGPNGLKLPQPALPLADFGAGFVLEAEDGAAFAPWALRLGWRADPELTTTVSFP